MTDTKKDDMLRRDIPTHWMCDLWEDGTERQQLKAQAWRPIRKEYDEIGWIICERIAGDIPGGPHPWRELKTEHAPIDQHSSRVDYWLNPEVQGKAADLALEMLADAVETARMIENNVPSRNGDHADARQLLQFIPREIAEIDASFDQLLAKAIA